jgi:heme/copper-type cytochrome/quinol oxidase subunit 1
LLDENLVSSFGSIISVVATWLFLNILYVQLVEGKSVYRYPWAMPQFYADYLQFLLNRAFLSLEWCLNSPPKPHAFASLPVQSVLLDFLLNGHIVYGCMEITINGVLYYFYYSVDNILLGITSGGPIIPS